MKVIITGGTGFLGRHLVAHAVAQSAEVIFTGRNAEAAKYIERRANGLARWQSIEHGTQQAAEILTEISQNADIFIHNAALSAPWGEKAAFYRANVLSSKEAIQACRVNYIARAVVISTPSVYFNYQDKLDIREDGPLPPPVNEYAHSKREAERLWQQAGLPSVAVMRPRALFGEWDSTLLPRMLKVMQNGGVPLVRGGRILLDITYVDNAVDAIWRAATQPLPQPFQIYNVSNDAPCTLIDLLHSISRHFYLPLRTRPIPWTILSQMARFQEWQASCRQQEPLFTRYSAGVLAFSQTLNVDALKQLGWQAKVSLEEGLARTAAWWQEQAHD
ncbi:NAD-dependent epimerase/dehydratase family protein [Suttonella ornithocola]|uniref:dTDP-glucose 4,6-dehydratase n=1 Tax=Suttonella ornithocola TaxID=279832 RepID=A0A380MZY4_9GAMM|nr:NAD(P)-dependent oxidoreductase [Suttonella ornithocola]SUO97828.1 dTDP-glucose 4,6-dehydratase [Suttonella ornithocola]